MRKGGREEMPLRPVEHDKGAEVQEAKTGGKHEEDGIHMPVMQCRSVPGLVRVLQRPDRRAAAECRAGRGVAAGGAMMCVGGKSLDITCDVLFVVEIMDCQRRLRTVLRYARPRSPRPKVPKEVVLAVRRGADRISLVPAQE